MTRSVHVTVGVGTMALLAVKQTSGFEFMGTNIIPVFAMITAFAGSYLPDFDTHYMHYTQGKKGVAKVAAKAKSKVVGKATGGHRGITHTLLFPIIFVALSYWIGLSFQSVPYLCMLLASLVFGFLAGWVLHIFADLFNGKGVPLLWPLTSSKIHIADFPSEGAGQWLWCLLYFVVIFMLLFGKEILG